MWRRHFLKTCALANVGALAAGLPCAGAAQETRSTPQPSQPPYRIIMGGYSPASTGFSLALKRIGDRLQAKFGKDVDVKYVYNILSLGYKAEDILWLVENGLLTMGYQSSSYFTERVPDVGIADLPFIFSTEAQARAAMDGGFGAALAQRIEAKMDYRILGWFENGFRHISNRLRPIHAPADMKGMRIRVLPSKVQERTFELIGASPKIMDLTEVVPAINAGTLDAQENPFFNTVTYGIHKLHRFHSATKHFYLSRPIFLNRPTFDAWPQALQDEMRAAVRDAVTFQRQLHEKEEEDSMVAIKAAGGEIVDITAEQRQAFVSAVTPIYGEARRQYGRDLLSLVNL